MKSLRVLRWFVAIVSAALPIDTIGSALWLDQTFHPPPFRKSVYAGGAAVMPSGKIVQYGYATLKDQLTRPITRYFPDGTLDQSFNFASGFSGPSVVTPIGDNKLLMAAQQRIPEQPYNPSPEQRVLRILRINEDGSIDPSFSADARSNNAVRAIVVQNDGKILVAGAFTTFAGLPRHGIVRLLPNGELDPDFAAVTLQPRPFASRGVVVALAIIPTNGKIVIGGSFSGVNSVNFDGIARLNPDGTLDSTFHPSGFSGARSTRAIVLQSDQKIVLGGLFRVPEASIGNRSLVRLGPDGSADQNYGAGSDGDFGIGSLAIQPDDKIIAAGFFSVVRFNIDGSVDTSFHQPELIDRGLQPLPQATNIQLDGQGGIVVAGWFSNIKNAGDPAPFGEHFSLARLHSDGTVDNSLVTSHETALNVLPIAFRLDSDGSTRVIFEMNLRGFLQQPLEPFIPHNFGRLRPDGSFDPDFDPLASSDPNGELGPGFVITDVATFLPNGNLFVRATNDGNYDLATMLLPDGRPVQNYQPDFYNTFSYVTAYGLTVLLDYLDVWLSPLERLNHDGSVDSSFGIDEKYYSDTSNFEYNDSPVAADHKVLAVLQDGKILFGYLAIDHTYRVVRLNADGSFDPSFQSGSVPVSTVDGFVNLFHGSLAPAIPAIFAAERPFTDAQELGAGDIVLVGEFTTYSGHNTAHGIVRLKHDGTLDPNFHAGAGAQWTQTVETPTNRPVIDNIEFSSDGKLLITGTFEAFDGTPAPGVASLNQDGSLDSTFIPPVAREKFVAQTTRLDRQSDGSYLLSGPYSIPGQSPAPSFVHINNATRFGIEAMTRLGFNVVITFNAVAGNTYRLEFKDNLSAESWTPVPGVGDLTASKTGLLRFTDPGAATRAQRFYSVRLVP